MILRGKDLRNGRFNNLPLAGSDFRRSDLSGCNFSNSDCSRTKFIGCILDRAIFRGTILDDCDFEMAKVDQLDLSGAIYKGKTITRGPVMLPSALYICFVTDVFTSLGCKTKLNDDWFAMNDTEKAGMDELNPKKAVDNWYKIVDELQAILNGWK